MCASYGLDPRFPGYTDYRRGLITLVELKKMVDWVTGNDGAVVRPTGKNARNLNPVFLQGGEFAEAWWGQIIGGEPAKFPSINTKLERVQAKPGLANRRVLVPASEWFEYQKPSKTRYAMTSDEPFMLAGLRTAGRLADGAEFICYSIITGPPAPHLEVIHDRMPVMLPLDFCDDWIDPDSDGSRELVDAAIAARDRIAPSFTATLAPAKKKAEPEALF